CPELAVVVHPTWVTFDAGLLARCVHGPVLVVRVHLYAVVQAYAELLRVRVCFLCRIRLAALLVLAFVAGVRLHRWRARLVQVGARALECGLFPASLAVAALASRSADVDRGHPYQCFGTRAFGTASGACWVDVAIGSQGAAEEA